MISTTMHTYTVTVTVQGPEGVRVTVTRPDGCAWDLKAANAYVVEQAWTMPAGGKLTIGVEICRSIDQEEQEICERAARDAAKSGTNLFTVAQALGVNMNTIAVAGGAREGMALAILKAAQNAGKDMNTILNAFALEG